MNLTLANPSARVRCRVMIGMFKERIRGFTKVGDRCENKRSVPVAIVTHVVVRCIVYLVHPTRLFILMGPHAAGDIDATAPATAPEIRAGQLI